MTDEPQESGPRFFEGLPCPRGHTRRYVSTAKCVECSRVPNKDADAVPAPSTPTRLHPLGQCKHGVGLRAFCRLCETAWYSRRRFEPKIYDDLVSYEPEAVPLNFESSLNGATVEPTRSHKRRGANATAGRRAPGRPRIHAAAVAET